MNVLTPEEVAMLRQRPAFGIHDFDCRRIAALVNGPPCNCGLDAARKLAAAHLAELDRPAAEVEGKPC